MGDSKDKNEKEKSWLKCQFHDAQDTIIIRPHEFKITNEDLPSLSHIKSNVVDRIRGSIFGLALGDALGAHVEFRPHAFMIANSVKDLEGGGTWGLQAGQFTDDTSMALCLANSLIACRDFVPYDQLVRYKWWHRHGYMSSTGSCFDIGAATKNSIEEFEDRQKIFAHEHSIPLDEIDSLSDPDLLKAFDVNCSQPNVAGNGALMRLAPVPLFFYKYPEIAVEYSGTSSKITHVDDKSIDACRYYGALIVAALQGEKREALLTERFYDEHEEWFGNREIHPDIMKIAKGSYKKPGGYDEGIRGKGYVVEALEAALWAFWSDEDSFEKGVLNAVNLGDDTDTTAAIYGQLAGAYYGYNKLPKKWVERIYAKDFILCVSSWVAYGGDQWATTQAAPDMNQIVNCITRIPTTNKSNRTNTPNVSTTKHTSHSSRQNTSFVCDITENTIARKVIDPNGRLGSFYDACQDHMELKTVPLNIKTKTVIPPIECRIINGEKLEGYNILQFIDFPIDLRLSILSNLVPLKGINNVINYPFAINQYTRIFYYSYVVRQQAIFEKENIQIMKNSANSVTHVVTAIDSGVDVVVLMRVSADGQKHTDSALQQLCNSLKQNKESSLDDHILGKIDSIYVYSNNSYISRSKTLLNVIKEIMKIKNDSIKHQPCNYILHPIDMFYSDPSQHSIKFIPTEPGIGKIVEDRWLGFLYAKKLWEKLQKNLDSEIWRIDLKHMLDSLNNRFTELAKKYDKERKKFKSIIVHSRQCKHPEENLLHQLDIEKHQRKDKQQIDEFKYRLRILKEKYNFIKYLKDNGFEYRTAASYKIDKSDTEETIQKKLAIDRQRQRFLCSNDRLNDIYWTELQKTLKQMLNEKKQTKNLKLIYVDLTYASCELDSFKVFPLKEQSCNHDANKLNLKIPQKCTSRALKHSMSQTFNIILIGKTGVGKSTLINTIVNCLQYNSLKQLKSNNSSLHIVVPFGMQVENEAEHHFVRLGGNDPNEDYTYSHSQRTQRCKSYRFNISHAPQLCIIDTPGFSETYDHSDTDKTMQHILSYLSEISCLNAICVVIDSINPKFGDYQKPLTKLLEFIGPQAMENLVFFFTKCLSTNDDGKQAQDEVRSLVRSSFLNKIKSPLIIQFDGTFFLDLAQMGWRNRQETKCEKSWAISKKGVEILIDYLRQNKDPYPLYQGIQRSEYARLKILQMVRPITEAIRNILQNMILNEAGVPQHWIELYPKPIHRSSAICFTCPHSFSIYGKFLIAHRSLHEYQNQCKSCVCNSNQHMLVDYQLEYQPVDTLNYKHEDLYNWFNDLSSASIQFANFLKHSVSYSTDDSFLTLLSRMIDEETWLGYTTYQYLFNAELRRRLLLVAIEYRKYAEYKKQNQMHNDLNSIIDLIEHVKNIPIIRKQMEASRGIRTTVS